MFSSFSQSQGCVLAPLVAHQPKTKASIMNFDVFFHDSSEELNRLREYEQSQDISKTSQGDYVVAERLRSFLADHQNNINVPFYGTRFIHNFIPYYTPPSNEPAQKNNESLRELRLAKCIACLQLLADPNLLARDHPNHAHTYLLRKFFARRQFSQDNLNLLFSYGLSYHSFRQAFKIYIKEIIYKQKADKVVEKSWLQLERCLENQASTTEKDAFAKEYKICREALNITEKHNPYIKCSQFLKQAYEAYLQNCYTQAANHYDAAQRLLTTFQSDKTLSPLILQDYAKRAEKCAAYYNICQNLAEKKQASSSSIQQLVSQCFSWNRQEKSPRLSDETDSTSSNEDLEPLLPLSKLKCT